MQLSIRKMIPWFLWYVVTMFLLGYFLLVADFQQGGDITEYYGITESLKQHGGVTLGEVDRQELEKVLHPSYFENPGYYVQGRDENRYPVHFVAYSVLAYLIRMVLHVFRLEELRTLWIVNILSLSGALWWIMSRYLKDIFGRLALLGLVYTSALAFFYVWPGPDLWYLSLLLVVPFAFFKGEYWLAACLSVLASWHSQPLIVLAAGITIYALFKSWLIKMDHQTLLRPDIKNLVWAGLLGLVALIPYAYNFYAFGVLTPWTKLQDGWTVMNGFGLHNASLRKFLEQWFDLNVGLFWYAPVIFILGLIGIIRMRKIKYELWYFVGMIFITAFFYQTNPAWHYGTVGFGPGRHGVYLLPILIYFALHALSNSKRILGIVIFMVVIASQLWGLSLNGYLEPDLTKTLYLSPYAEYALNRWPRWYNPTPEIFVDRVNHSDLDYPTSAVFKANGRCIKAYVLITELDTIEAECGSVPQQYRKEFDNPQVRVANYERVLVTKVATFWPEPSACADGFSKTDSKPYECMLSEVEFLRLTGLLDATRLSKVPDFEYPGVWKVNWGEPVKLSVPAGYIINHYSLDGIYVDYPIKE